MIESERVYRLGPEFFARLRREMITRGLPMAVLAAGAGLFIAQSRNEMEPGLMILLACFFFILVGFSVWNNHRKLVKRHQTFRIVTTAAGVERLLDGLPPLFIRADAIGRVVGVQGKGLTVQGQAPEQRIFIPETIQDFSQLRETIESWCSIEPASPSSWGGVAAPVAGLATLAGFVLVFTATTLALVAPVGVGLLAVFNWSLIAVLRSPYTEARLKRLVWLVLLPMAAIAARIWSLWQSSPFG